MISKRNNKSERSTINEVRRFYLEAKKTERGMTIMLGGIIGVSDFSDEKIILLSHGGRICVTGSKLFINVYEQNNVEIAGKVEAVSFKYGKA